LQRGRDDQRTKVLNEGVVKDAAEDDAQAVARVRVQQALPVVPVGPKHQPSVQRVLPHCPRPVIAC
jgi:hypothetical protein